MLQFKCFDNSYSVQLEQKDADKYASIIKEILHSKPGEFVSSQKLNKEEVKGKGSQSL